MEAWNNRVPTINRTLVILIGALILIGLPESGYLFGANGSGTTMSVISPEAFTRVGSVFWGSGGAGIAMWGNPGAPLSNPAGLSNQSLGFYLEGSQRFNTKWFADLDYDGQLIAPLYATAGFAAGDFSVAIGYANIYDERYSASLPVTTVENPNGTGQYFDLEQTVKTHVFFASASYPLDERLSLGLTMGIHDVRLHEQIVTVSADGGGIGLLLTAGALFKVSDHFSLGSTLRFESPTTFSETYTAPNLIRQGDTSHTGTALVSESFDYSARFPWTMSLGFAWSPISSVSFMASGEYQHWSHLADGYSNLVQLHLGVEVAVSEGVRLGAGFFTQDAPEDIPGNPLVENFLTFGIGWNVSPAVGLSASVIDSHLLSSSPSTSFFGPSDEHFRQSAVTLGISYSLPTQ